MKRSMIIKSKVLAMESPRIAMIGERSMPNPPSCSIGMRLLGQIAPGQLRKQVAQPLVGPLLMREPCQERHLLRPILPGSQRHIRPLIPSKHRLDRFHEGDLAGEGTEFLKRT